MEGKGILNKLSLKWSTIPQKFGMLNFVTKIKKEHTQVETISFPYLDQPNKFEHLGSP